MGANLTYLTRAAEGAGVSLPDESLLRLIGELSGMGPLLELVARPDVEDIAINLRHIYVYTTAQGWQHWGEAPEGIGDALALADSVSTFFQETKLG